MALDTMSDSCLFQLENYFKSNPYREQGMTTRPYIPRSAHSNRLTLPIDSFFPQRKNPLTFDRLAYKLRIKSDLNVETLRESHHLHAHYHTNSPNMEPRPTPRKVLPLSHRQMTASTIRTRQTSNGQRDIHGIEGNAVHVGTLNDLIRHFHQEEIRLIHHNSDYSDNLSTYTSNNRSTMASSERPPAFAVQRSMKQARPLTEYHFPDPRPSRTTLKISRLPSKLQLNSKRTDNNFLSKQNPTPPSTRLTILDPFSAKNIPPLVPSNGYIFPPMRAFGYYTRKTPDELPAYTPSLFRRRTDMKRLPRNSLESLGQLSTITDEKSQVLTEVDDDLSNPPNTRINVDCKEKN